MFDFIMTDINTIFIIITSIVSTASAIAALTPTTVDDGIIAKVRKVVDVLALNVGNAKPVKAAN